MTNSWDNDYPEPDPERLQDPEPPQPAQRLYNVESLGRAPAEVIFVDTYDDVLAMIESNYVNAVCFDGELSTEQNDAIGNNYDILKGVKRIVLAGSKTKRGMMRREQIASRLGRHLCLLVLWPPGCKTAAETLTKEGPEVVRGCLEAAESYPFDGLYKPSATTLLNLRARPAPTTMTIGIDAVDAILRFPTEGRLIVLTGWPNGGKTALARFIMVQTALNHGRRWAVFSPEMMPWEQFTADCAEVYNGKCFWPSADFDSMDENEIGAAGTWLRKWLTMIVCDAEDVAPTLPWLLDRLREAVLRDGVTDALFDPWNEMEHARDRNMTETEYIGRSLQQIKAFCARHSCNAWIIAHPAKPQGIKTGERKPPPGPYEISGSSHWANKPDLGITVDSSGEDGESLIQVWKARFRRFGSKNTEARMLYNKFNGRYSDPIGPIATPPGWRRPYNEDE